MSLEPGTRIGAYEIAARIGAGGMGEVYRATDTNLKRQVAIKVLPEAVAADAERLARFQREAEVLASLNHPNIAGVYGLERSGGTTALVMELVEGPTLADRIEQGRVPVDEALAMARQIAEALEAAHERGIIHRDLKPANVKLRPDGAVKVLDFGLAKAVDRPGGSPSSLSMSPTITTPAMTQAGLILGTAAYMSPEQARGKPVDRRADIWAFGVVLYEMITGRRPFQGEDLTETLAAVVKVEPDLDAVPATLRKLVARCLAKDPRHRLRDIGDAWELLVEEGAATPMPASPRRGVSWPALAGILATVAAVGLWGWLRPAPVEPRPLVHFVSAAPQGIFTYPLVLSPDGSTLAYVGISDDRIFLRRMDDPVAKPVPGTAGASFPVFSPDGQWLAFFAGAGAPFELKKIPVAGGAASTVATDLPASLPMSWGEDGNLLLGGPGVFRVPESGGPPMEITRAEDAQGGFGFSRPQLLPGGELILVSAVADVAASLFNVVAIDAVTGTERRVLLESVGETHFLPTGSRPGIGHLVYGLSGSLFAAAFDANRLEVGRASPVWEGLQGLGGLSPQGFSSAGTLAYPTGSGQLGVLSSFIWADRQGGEQAVSAAVQQYEAPRLSRDGDRLAFQSFDDERNLASRIWVRDMRRGTTTPLTFDGDSFSPVWTPDGQWLVYVRRTGGTGFDGYVEAIPPDGSGQPIRLTDNLSASNLMSNNARPMSVSPDGTTVMGVSGSSVWVLPLDLAPGADLGVSVPRPFLDDRFVRGEFRFSPDGKWVAYQSNESGRNQVYVVPYPGPGGRTQISSDGGTQPRWNPRGSELFFRSGDALMAVDVQTGDTFDAGAPHLVFEKAAADYDVSPDGQRFLMLKPAETAGSSVSELHVVLNFFDELRRLVPLDRN
jgi:serine/threonine-protein kinase